MSPESAPPTGPLRPDTFFDALLLLAQASEAPREDDLPSQLRRLYAAFGALLGVDHLGHLARTGGGAGLEPGVHTPAGALSPWPVLSDLALLRDMAAGTAAGQAAGRDQLLAAPGLEPVGRLGVTALAAWPVQENGEVLAVLCATSSRQGDFPEHTLALLRALAAHVGLRLRQDHVQRAVKHREHELQEAASRKDKFLAVLAHELRNPLAPLRSGLDVLRATPADPEVQRKALALMARQLDHLVRVVNDLLDAARIETGHLQVHRERIPLIEALGPAIETVRPALEAKRHRLWVLGDAEQATVSADKVRLAQVIANLLNNAARYTPEGGNIEVRTEKPAPETVSVQVCDEGPGIAPSDLPFIFEPFARAGGHAPGDGMGVGLALAKGLAALHEGTLAAENREGGGAAFTLTLPVDAPAPFRPGGEGGGGEALGGPAPGEPALRVLIVDDNQDAADSLGMLLELSGHLVRAVNDGAAAVEETEAFLPHLIFMDLGMAGMGGIEATERIRGLALPERPFVAALTGWAQATDREATRRAGFDLHLVKPVDLGDIEDALRRAAAGRAAQAA